MDKREAKQRAYEHVAGIILGVLGSDFAHEHTDNDGDAVRLERAMQEIIDACELRAYRIRINRAATSSDE